MRSLSRVGFVVLPFVALLGLGVFARNQYRARRAEETARQVREAQEASMAVVMKDRREALLHELRETVTLSNCEPTRVGSTNDGGYAMCKNLLDGTEVAYSYGIGGQDDWGCAISVGQKITVHQYDCFNPTNVRCPGGSLKLNAECVGPRAEGIEGRAYDSMTHQIARNGDQGKKKIVKMDVEGSEWQTILTTPDDVFESITQLPMELHGTDDPDIVEGLRKLKQHFHLVSVHFNNWVGCPDPKYRPVPAGAYQVLLVNTKVGIVGPPPPGSPSLESVLAPDNPTRVECKPGVPAP